jgi:hypothetical protein
MRIFSAKDLTVYQKAFANSMTIFEESKTFPVEERYALTSQIRRSSRSGVFEPTRSMGETTIRASFHQ